MAISHYREPFRNGARLKNDTETWGDVARTFFPQAYGSDAAGTDGGIFSEFVEMEGWNVPKYTSFPDMEVTTEFCRRWFKYGQNKNNMFQFLTSNLITNFSGVANSEYNTSTVCFNGYSQSFREEVAVHEIGHLCDLMEQRLIISDHVDQPVRKQVHPGYVGTQSCIMSYLDYGDGITEFDMDCIRHARKQPDPE